MRELLPEPGAEVDLVEAYRYPDVADRPWVRANMVASVDGSAQVEGRSGGLGTPADKQVFDVLRGLADVVLVGSATVLAEGYGPARPKPAYAGLRAALGQSAAPVLAVVSRRLDITPDHKVFGAGARAGSGRTGADPPTGTDGGRTIVLTSADSPADRRAALGEVADVVVAGHVGVDLRAAVDALAGRRLRRVLCEGGPAVLAQVAAAGLLDELCLTVSPLLVAGDGSRVLHGDWLRPPTRLRLGHLLEDDGTLLARYLVRR
jgi:riboflavin biosynthesis pyrimidine reductase